MTRDAAGPEDDSSSSGSGSGSNAVGRPLRLGTRASLLATRQSEWVAERLRAASGEAVELVPMTSQGDLLRGSLASLGGTGVFATALRDALRAHECDLVVHSLKDLPTAPTPGLTLAAIPERELANDVLCARDGLRLAELPTNAVVGTGSPRRTAQLLRARPDLRVTDIRGNIDTRLGKVQSGEFDAVVLAAAGLRRIGRADAASEQFALSSWPSSAGQGALAIEVRADDDRMLALAGLLADPVATATARLERALLGALEAGCAAPLGISTELLPAGVKLVAEVYSLDGIRTVRVERTLTMQQAQSAEHTAAQLRDELLAAGAAELAPLGSTGRPGAGELG